MTSQYDTFLYWLGQLETGSLRNPERIQPQTQYHHVENEKQRTGRIGKYQFGESILQNLGYYEKSNQSNQQENAWNGKWLGRRGIKSFDDFLYNCDAQEYIVREEMNFLWGRIRLFKLDYLVGKTEKGILVTESGLLVGAHMFGPSGLKYLFQDAKGQDVTERRLLGLLQAFAGFQTPYGKVFPESHSKSEFVRYIKTGLSPRIADDAQSIPKEQTTTYIWETQGDDRVRESHAANDGETFDANDPPATGNPGDDYGCRCWAELCISSDFLPYNLGDSFENLPSPPVDVKDLSISQGGVQYIARWEGFSPKTYLDSAQKPTIGYGHLLKAGEAYPNGISREEALRLLKSEAGDAEKAVREGVRVQLTQSQYDALVSFAYNVGVGAFEQSTLLRLINQEKYVEAGEQFLRWNKITVNGKVSEDPGLSNRRSSEKALFEMGAYD